MRWIAIRASAALAILGSALTLLLCAVFAWMALRTPVPGETVPLRPLIGVLAVFFAVLTVWGFATAAGVFRRREWARASMVIFAVLLVGMGLSALLGIIFVRFPQPAPEAGGGVMVNIRLLIAAFYGGMALIGAWWLLLFNSSQAKRYFAETPEESREPEKPLSIRIIGWYLLVCAVLTALAAALRVPAMLFGLLITGWATLGIYTVFTAVEIYLGTGLLQLQKGAQIGAIGFFTFAAVSSAVSILLPGFEERMRAVQAYMPRVLQAPRTELPFDNVWPFAAVSVFIMAVPICFLIWRRRAFR
jgi:hypothetical protein